MGIGSPEKEKVLNEQFLDLSKVLKTFNMNNLKIMEKYVFQSVLNRSIKNL